jgi:hypothetical protein
VRKMERSLLISCGIFQPEIEKLIALGEIEADVIFLDKYLHFDFQELYKTSGCVLDGGQ